ncbi:allophanate hydrolase subunit 1 [Arsenicitalea aurantiaca]|uniref:Allophanate hydrolase subunit 1 n=1 Tax=Arsenicitalea aurantiaca TaxID=1783274 RepID=A0A433XFK3_9HYPH|nr:allophanate hydrolase subunit 1 [Arsenicitalea aurantiaca]RUT32865.1 allophanate hydrolase subunit 1 [Arsenicitalea aurantiaca]
MSPDPSFRPTLLPLGDAALLIRFADALSEPANRAAIALGRALLAAPPQGVLEIQPSLVSVLLRYDPRRTRFADLAGEIRLRVGSLPPAEAESPVTHEIAIAYGGPDGPDLKEVLAATGLTRSGFLSAHAAGPLRVLATGFAPGFVYCGFHPEPLHLPRRQAVRRSVPAGSVLFAAGQTAIAATAIPTGWHVIGRTDLRNFDPAREPVTRLAPGDLVAFRSVP